MPDDTSKIIVTISVSDHSLSNISEIVEQLKTAGLKNPKALRSIGVITGVVSNTDLLKVSQVPGVQSVERSRRVRGINS